MLPWLLCLCMALCFMSTSAVTTTISIGLPAGRTISTSFDNNPLHAYCDCREIANLNNFRAASATSASISGGNFLCVVGPKFLCRLARPEQGNGHCATWRLYPSFFGSATQCKLACACVGPFGTQLPSSDP